jgi:hypothetical protein
VAAAVSFGIPAILLDDAVAAFLVLGGILLSVPQMICLSVCPSGRLSWSMID